MSSEIFRVTPFQRWRHHWPTNGLIWQSPHQQSASPAFPSFGNNPLAHPQVSSRLDLLLMISLFSKRDMALSLLLSPASASFTSTSSGVWNYTTPHRASPKAPVNDPMLQDPVHFPNIQRDIDNFEKLLAAFPTSKALSADVCCSASLRASNSTRRASACDRGAWWWR